MNKHERRKATMSILLDVWGGPPVQDREKKFRGSLVWCRDLFDKLIESRDKNIPFEFSPEEKWIILEAFRFAVTEFYEEDVMATSDTSFADADKIVKEFKEEWGNDIKKPSDDYQIRPLSLN